MAAQDTRKPTGMMDFDTEDRLLPANHYRYGKNGRSGTSDKDGEGAVEAIRGNVLRDDSFTLKGREIGSCPDVKNNAIIKFIAGEEVDVTYTSAQGTIFGTDYITVVGPQPSYAFTSGNVIRVEQNTNVFTGKILSNVGDLYLLQILSGTGATNTPITKITWLQYNYIRRYFVNTDTFEYLTNPELMSSSLGFTPTRRIYNPRVIESTFGQLLTWTEYPSGIPCLMNIDRMKQGGQYYNTAADTQYIRIAKQPPYKQPSLAYYYDETAIDYLTANGYQFRYRYVYDDSQGGVYSPISVLSISPQPYNSIGVTVNSGHPTVTHVDLLVRQGNGDVGSTNNEWYLFKSVNKTDEGWSNNTDYEVRFYGNELLTAISRIDSDKISESVPISADAIEVTDDNQIIAGGITEGYDNVDMNVQMDLAYRDTGIYNYQIFTNTPIDNYTAGTLKVGNTLYLRVIVSLGNYEETFYKLTADDLASYPDNLGARIVNVLGDLGANYTYNSGSKTITRTSGYALSQLTVIDAEQELLFESTSGAITQTSINIIDALFTDYFAYNIQTTLNVSLRYQASGGPMDIEYIVNGSTVDTKTITLTTSYQSFLINNTIKLDTGDTFEIRFTGGTLLNPIQLQAGWTCKNYGKFNYQRQGFKYDSTVYSGIVYYDEYMRSSFVQELGEVQIPNLTSVADNRQYSRLSPIAGYIPYLSWQIKNVPPVWAKYYQFVLKESTVSEFSYFVVKSSTIDGANKNITYVSMDNYIPQVGDVVRHLGATTGLGAQKYLFDKLSNQGWLDVLSVDLTTKTIQVRKTIGGLSDEASIIEIRRKAPVTSRFYFECSNFYEIGNPGTAIRYHKGETQNQDPNNPIGTPAEGTIKNGQVWFRFHYDPELTWTSDQQRVYYVESFYPIDGSSLIGWDRGRPFIASQYAKQTYLPTGLRWSGQLINQSLVNNLSTWDEGNYNNTINTKFGAITGMRQIGYTLKILQWANINTAFIKRREVQNADGSTQLVVTDSLIGTINPSEKEFGTKYPGSIISTGQRMYYFDSLKSNMIVDDGNGVNEIALYGAEGTAFSTMSKYFRALANKINANGNYYVLTGFDYLYRDMYFSTVNYEENTQETLYYNETQNAWKYFVDMEHVNLLGTTKYIIDNYASVGQNFFAGMKGNTFQFNKAESGGQSVYLELFKINNDDPLKPLVVETIGMIEPDKVKVFQTHALHANLEPELVELFIPANEMYPNGMYSRLKPANYKYREGVFYADIKRDAFTKGFTTNETQIRTQIASGRPLRGHVCLCRITFRNSNYTKLFTTSLGMTPSELS